ncbi:MAG: LuxR family transcriptional regulator [Bdellovibrionales bacterium]
MDLLDFVTRSSEATTVEELEALLSESLRELCGLQYYVFGLETDHSAINIPAGHGLLSNYPTDWMKYYVDKGFADIDAVRRFGHLCSGTFAWDAIPSDFFQSRRAQDCRNGGEDAGLKHGVCAPLRGPFGQIAGLAAASDSYEDCTTPQKLALFNVISYQFYTRFIEIHRNGSREQKALPKLAPREKDVMSWAARGKTNAEISDILSLSPNYVREIVSNVMEKYNASNRVSAVLMAIYSGEIDASDLIVRPLPKKSSSAG